MNRHALDVLQFPAAVDIVAGLAANDLGAEAVRALEPVHALSWIEDELDRVDQAQRFLVRVEDWGVPVIPDLREALRRLEVEGSVWEPGTLADACRLLTSAAETRKVVRRHAEEFPAIATAAGKTAALADLVEAIDRAIDDAGEVRDDATRELGRLRHEIRGARAKIVQALERYMASLPEAARVPDASVSVRDGRFVIPVRRGERREVGGIVHDESASGGTLFVEPPVAIDMMNRLRSMEIAEGREVRRILRELTARARQDRVGLVETLEALVDLDSLFARARYALRHNAARPALGATDGDYLVVQGRHPLLLAGTEATVPFSLELEPGERTLVVSGPNTGGKTVLLKAIGLLSAMTQAGIVPPVGDGTRIPVFRDIFADIGDEQSIEASLSTFSAHLRNLREIIDEAGRDSLVLIDEIGSGTDPQEGGALARAVLMELNRRSAMTVATSHLGQLKLLAGEVEGVVNASLQFDSRELRPTYRLVKGVPGRSYGLAIARRLGFPDGILERAEELLPQGERDVSQLLLDLEETERETEAALREAEAARREAERLRGELEDRRDEVARREREAERRARQQARDLLLHSRKEVEAAIRELREAMAGGDEAALEREATRARRRVEEAARRQAEKAPSAPTQDRPPADVQEGARVRVPTTGATGRVVELRDGRASVETGGLKMDLPAESLEVLDEPGREDRHAGGGWTGPAPEASPEVDLRGLRAEEVQARLVPALDAAIQANLRHLTVIHGKGTGVLREVVAELLDRDARVAGYRAGGPGEGGAGVTVVELP